MFKTLKAVLHLFMWYTIHYTIKYSILPASTASEHVCFLTLNQLVKYSGIKLASISIKPLADVSALTDRLTQNPSKKSQLVFILWIHVSLIQSRCSMDSHLITFTQPYWLIVQTVYVLELS